MSARRWGKKLARVTNPALAKDHPGRVLLPYRHATGTRDASGSRPVPKEKGEMPDANAMHGMQLDL